VVVERPRRVEVLPFPSNRRLVTAAMRAGRRKMPMYGLVDVDMTTANRLLAGHDPPCALARPPTSPGDPPPAGPGLIPLIAAEIKRVLNLVT
jgi:hypothetical protein